MSPYAGYLVETFITLGAVCALAAGLLWGAKRAGLSPSAGPIELRGLLRLDGRRAVYLVKVVDTVYVVGAGEAGFVKLGELPASSLPEAAVRGGPSFAEVLARVTGRRASTGSSGGEGGGGAS